jgi:hypothetical protein
MVRSWGDHGNAQRLHTRMVRSRVDVESGQENVQAEGHDVVPWEYCGRLLEERREYQVQTVELRRDKPCSVAPSSYNDVVTSTVLVASSNMLAAIQKRPGMQRWPMELGLFFKSLPHGSQMRLSLT